MITDGLVSAVDEKIHEDRRFIISSLESEFTNMGRTILHKIFSEKFKFRKLCARWVPRLLAEEQIRSFGWDQIDHPPYSPDLAPSIFHLFRYPKEFLGLQALRHR